MTGTEVVNWEEKLAAEAKAVAKSERPSVARIGLKSGIMTYQDQALPGNQLDCIIVAAIHENVYYDKPYDPDVLNPPACYAYSLDGENMVPHEDIEEPQNPTCRKCWANEFRSARNKKGKACGERRKLAVIPAYKDVADIEKAEIAILSLPVMSVKNWATYVNILSSTPTIQRASWGVLTRISVKPDPKSQFKVYFDHTANLNRDFLSAVYAKVPVALNILQTPYDLTPPEEKEEEPEQPAAGKKKKF